MMTTQRQAAMQSMIEWLADERELGKEPSKIEIAGEFDLYGMHYYIFKYKKSLLGKWLLGVCGGYEHDLDTEHCGHVFSEMQPYDPATAQQEAIVMVEMIREFWMKQAAALEEGQQEANSEESQNDKGGLFNGFVLLDSHECDMEQIKRNLLQDWNISCTEAEEADRDNAKETDGTLVFEADGCMAALSFVDAPIPDGEAEHNAQANYLWKEAVEKTQAHVAQIIVAVFTRSGSPLDSGKLYAKLTSSCLKLPNAVGLYSSGTVFHPGLFVDFAELMKTDDDMFPLLNLVHFGLVRTENGISGYTFGLKAFGKDEIEVLDTQASPSELRDFLIDISGYVIEHNVTLKDGETIGFSAEHKLPIVRSEGVYVEGSSLKIKF